MKPSSPKLKKLLFFLIFRDEKQKNSYNFGNGTF